MSSTEEIIAAPSANGLGKSPAIENSSSPADKAEIKSTAMNDEVSQLTNAEEKHGEDKSALENHESPSADVEMKEAKEKTPEPDNQNLDKKPSSSDKPLTDEKKTPSPEKPKTDEDKQKSKEDNADEIKDTSGEEKMECVITAPLTTKEKESGTEGEKEESDTEGGQEEEEKEHDQEQQEKGTSPRKRKRAPFSPRKRSQKKSTPKKKADEKPSKETEKTTKQVEKSPEKTSKDEEKDSSASAVAEKSPRKSTESPRKRQKTPTAEQEDDTTPDTSPKSSKGTPLLEAPLIIEGKRNRQRVERLDTQMLTPTQKTVDVPQGKGLKLGEISFIDAMISKTPTNDLKGLHRFFFGRPGTPNEIRKNVKNFCGFSDEKEIERKKKILDSSFVTNDLKKICEVLGLEVGGRKEDLIERAMKFLIEPKDLGKKTPAPKRKRSTATSSRKRSRSSTTRGKGASSSKKSETDEGSANEEEEEDAAEEAEPEMDDKKEATENEEEENEPKAKKTKRGEKATTSSAASAATPSKRGQPKRAAKNAKKPSYPSDAEIKTTIKELLKGMNLEEVTMKEMTKKVYDKYPQVDISSKKDFIKETVKTLLSATD